MIFLHKNAIGVSFPRRTSRITVTLCLTMGSAKGKGKADGMGGLCWVNDVNDVQNNRWIALRSCGAQLRGHKSYFKDLP